MKKRIFTTAFILALALAMLAGCGEKGGTKKQGDFEYMINEENEVVIVGYVGTSDKVQIPEKINGKPVKHFGDTFNARYNITEVIIPDSVTSIDYCAFNLCTGLTSVTIPNSVTIIDMYAFAGCSGLTSITIPDSVTSIGYGAFRNCTGLTNITIPDSVTSIGEAAFKNCTGLTSITIPDSVTSIGKAAFEDCTRLSAKYKGETYTIIYDYFSTEDKEPYYDLQHEFYFAVNGK